MKSDSTTFLDFVLSAEDDWPPVSSEVIPCNITPMGYEIEKAPLFVKNLSAGDIITVTEGSETRAVSWDHVKKSNRSTVWLLRIGATDEIDPILAYVRTLGCNTSSLPELGVFSIDVPEQCQMNLVDDPLKTLNEECVAIAYPSFRHT